MTTNVLMTGAYGQVGTAIIDHLAGDDGYSFTFLDIDDHPSRETFVADVSNFETIRPAFEDQDAVIHLAASPKPSDPWDEVLENNVIGTYNVMEAVREAEVPQVVFASSHHVMGNYERDHRPALYDPDYPLTVDHEMPVRPDSYYALSKLFGENIGRYYVESKAWPTRFYALRICNVGPERWDHPWGWAERAVESGDIQRGSPEYEERLARHRGHWCSRRDIAQLVECCLRDPHVDFDVFYGVSGNRATWWDLEHARVILGYEPEDDASTWDSPPDGIPEPSGGSG